MQHLEHSNRAVQSSILNPSNILKNRESCSARNSDNQRNDMKNSIKLFSAATALVLSLVSVATSASVNSSTAIRLEIPASAVCAAEHDSAQKEDMPTIQPDELAKQLSGDKKPVVFQTGIVHLYRMSHIPGSIFAGPANSQEGLDKLKKEVEPLSKDRAIVLYCGCCPWEHCPNVRPAYAMLRQMGYKNVKVLNIPHTFTEDWVSKGLPVEKG